MNSKDVEDQTRFMALICGLLFAIIILTVQFCSSPEGTTVSSRLPSHTAMMWCRGMFPDEQSCIVNCHDDRETDYFTDCSVRPGSRNIIGIKCDRTGCFIPYH